MEEEIIRVSHEVSIKEFFNKLPEFKTWIEQTQLFNVIKQESNPATRAYTGIAPKLVSDKIQLQLREGVIITKAEDLPVEMIMVFYENSPYTSPTYRYSTNKIKLIENDTNKEAT